MGRLISLTHSICEVFKKWLIKTHFHCKIRILAITLKWPCWPSCRCGHRSATLMTRFAVCAPIKKKLSVSTLKKCISGQPILTGRWALLRDRYTSITWCRNRKNSGCFTIRFLSTSSKIYTKWEDFFMLSNKDFVMYCRSVIVCVDIFSLGHGFKIWNRDTFCLCVIDDFQVRQCLLKKKKFFL